MSDKDVVFALRKRIFYDWKWKRLTWQEVNKKYGFSKRWFYKWLKRFIKDGDDGLRDRQRDNSNRPHRLTEPQKLGILSYIFDYPTHGPNNIAEAQTPRISNKTVWRYLKTENLNTRRKRRLWAHAQGKPVLTQKEQQIMSAKHNHIESHFPGELVGLDTFTVNVKGLGKIFQFTACDTFSSYGWARCYFSKTQDNAIDFFIHHILKNVPAFKIKRILTDQGTEFYSARHPESRTYFTRMLNNCGVEHTVTKVAHPWTNGYVERLNQTIWQEFYLCLLQRPYDTLDRLNADLQKFMTDYNFKRRHTGYKLKNEGLQFPGHAFFDIRENANIIEIKY